MQAFTPKRRDSRRMTWLAPSDAEGFGVTWFAADEGSKMCREQPLRDQFVDTVELGLKRADPLIRASCSRNFLCFLAGFLQFAEESGQPVEVRGRP